MKVHCRASCRLCSGAVSQSFFAPCSLFPRPYAPAPRGVYVSSLAALARDAADRALAVTENGISLMDGWASLLRLASSLPFPHPQASRHHAGTPGLTRSSVPFACTVGRMRLPQNDGLVSRDDISFVSFSLFASFHVTRPKPLAITFKLLMRLLMLCSTMACCCKQTLPHTPTQL